MRIGNSGAHRTRTNWTGILVIYVGRPVDLSTRGHWPMTRSTGENGYDAMFRVS